jgi:hypothetical protein
MSHIKKLDQHQSGNKASDMSGIGDSTLFRAITARQAR